MGKRVGCDRVSIGEPGLQLGLPGAPVAIFGGTDGGVAGESYRLVTS